MVFLLVWELAPRIGLVEGIFLPPFSEVLGKWVQLAANGQLWENLGASLGHSVAGFSIAIVVAVPLGVVIGSARCALWTRC